MHCNKRGASWFVFACSHKGLCRDSHERTCDHQACLPIIMLCMAVRSALDSVSSAVPPECRIEASHGTTLSGNLSRQADGMDSGSLRAHPSLGDPWPTSLDQIKRSRQAMTLVHGSPRKPRLGGLCVRAQVARLL
jgi:hypothetical protein